MGAAPTPRAGSSFRGSGRLQLAVGAVPQLRTLRDPRGALLHNLGGTRRPRANLGEKMPLRLGGPRFLGPKPFFKDETAEHLFFQS